MDHPHQRGITMVFPFYWMIITSIKIQSEVMKIPPVLFPTRITFERYGRVIGELQFRPVLLQQFVHQL